MYLRILSCLIRGTLYVFVPMDVPKTSFLSTFNDEQMLLHLSMAAYLLSSFGSAPIAMAIASMISGLSGIAVPARILCVNVCVTSPFDGLYISAGRRSFSA